MNIIITRWNYFRVKNNMRYDKQRTYQRRRPWAHVTSDVNFLKLQGTSKHCQGHENL